MIWNENIVYGWDYIRVACYYQAQAVSTPKRSVDLYRQSKISTASDKEEEK